MLYESEDKFECNAMTAFFWQEHSNKQKRIIVSIGIILSLQFLFFCASTFLSTIFSSPKLDRNVGINSLYPVHHLSATHYTLSQCPDTMFQILLRSYLCSTFHNTDLGYACIFSYLLPFYY